MSEAVGPSGRITAVLLMSSLDTATAWLLGVSLIVIVAAAARSDAAKAHLMDAWRGRIPFDMRFPVGALAGGFAIFLSSDLFASTSQATMQVTRSGFSAVTSYLVAPAAMWVAGSLVWPVLRRSNSSSGASYLSQRFSPILGGYAGIVTFFLMILGTACSLVVAATWLVPAANWAKAASVALLVLSGAAATAAALAPSALASAGTVLGMLLLLGGALLTFFAASAAGGLSTLYHTLLTSQHALNLGVTPPFMHLGGDGTGATSRAELLASPWAADASPWAGILAAPFALCWWLMADPAVLQWVLPLRSAASRRGAVAVASVMSLAAFYLTGVTGVVARLRLGKTMSCSPTGRPCGHDDMTMGAMVTLLMPSGLRGLLVATLLGVVAWRWASHIRALTAMCMRAVFVPACPKRVPAFQTLGGQAAAAADFDGPSSSTVRTQRLLWAASGLALASLSLAWVGQVDTAGRMLPAATAVVETPVTFGAPLGALVLGGVLFPWMKWHGAAFGLALAHLGAFLRLVTSPAAHKAAAAVAAGEPGAADSIAVGQWTLGGTSVLLYTLVEIAVCLSAASLLSVCGAPAFPELGGDAASRLLSRQGLQCAARCSRGEEAAAYTAAADACVAAEVQEEEQRALVFLTSQGRGDGGVLPTSKGASTRRQGGRRAAGGGAAYAVVGTGEVDSLVQAEEDVVLDLDSDAEEQSGTLEDAAAAPGGGSPADEGAFEDPSTDFAVEISQGVPDGAVDAVLRDDEQESTLWWYVNVAVQAACLLTLVGFW